MKLLNQIKSSFLQNVKKGQTVYLLCDNSYIETVEVDHVSATFVVVVNAKEDVWTLDIDGRSLKDNCQAYISKPFLPKLPLILLGKRVFCNIFEHGQVVDVDEKTLTVKFSSAYTKSNYRTYNVDGCLEIRRGKEFYFLEEPTLHII